MRIVVCVAALGIACILGVGVWSWLGAELPASARAAQQRPKLPASRLASQEPLRDATAARLVAFEQAVAQFHASAVNVFIEAEDFGQFRMTPVNWNSLELQGAPPPEIVSTEGLEREPKVELRPLEKLHLLSSVRFAAQLEPGLESSNLPLVRRWKVAAIDLIGLVMHETPTAYVAKKPPKMEELRAAPTRPLDTFERLALEKLHAGDDVFVRSAGTHLRMVGGIRAGETCLRCHDGTRGDLLGAFSYTLTPADPRTAAALP